MAEYEIITPRPGNAPYSLTGSMYIGGPPPVGQYTANSDNSLQGWWRCNKDPSIDSQIVDSSNKNRPANNNLPVFSSTDYPSKLIQAASCTWDGLTTAPNVGTAALWDTIIGSDTANGATQKMSFSMWVKKTGNGDSVYPRLFQFGDDGNNLGQVWAFVEVGGRIHFSADFTVGRGEWRTGGMILPPSGAGLGWNHILITYDATSTSNTPMLYLNGVSYPFFIYSGLNPNGSYTGIKGDPCIIGNRSGQDRTFEGSIADFAVWNEVLTAADALTLHAARLGPIYYTYRNFDLIGYGQRLSPTGSQERLSLQGVDAQPDDIYFPSLLPRVRQGAPMSLWRQGEKISDKYFDDTLAMNPNPQDMRGVGDIKVTQRMNFDWEKLNFGQAPVVQQGESYVETNRFNPINFILSPEETMWPVNLFNLGSLLDHEFDGIIEPLDIRSELLGIVRSRFEGHSVRAGLTGGASETYFGSKQIVDKWHDNDAKAPFFLDAPLNWGTIPISAFSNITQEPDAPFYDKTAFEITTSPLMMNNPQLSGLNGTYSVFDGYSLGSQLLLPLKRNCLAWWRLDQDYSVSGNVSDSSGNNRTGTFPSADSRVTFDTETPASYIQEGSSHFAGETIGTVKIDIGADTIWDGLIGGTGNAAKPFSISVWIYFEDLGGNNAGRVIDFGGDRRLWMTSPSPADAGYGRLKFEAGSIGSECYSSNISGNAWHHVVCTYTGGSDFGGDKKARLYVNASQHDVETQTTTTGINGDCLIGNNLVGGYAFQGYIADVSVWDVRLKWAKVKALYSARNGVCGRGLRNDPLITALKQMNTGSYPVVDPVEERANHGFYFGKNAGSIVYGDE